MIAEPGKVCRYDLEYLLIIINKQDLKIIHGDL
jgi:hypothetical protein